MRFVLLIVVPFFVCCIAPEEILPDPAGPSDGLRGIESHNCDPGLFRTGDFVSALDGMSALGRGRHRVANAVVSREPQNAWADITFDLMSETGVRRAMNVAVTCTAPSGLIRAHVEIESLSPDEYEFNAIGVQSICATFSENVMREVMGDSSGVHTVRLESTDFVASSESEVGYFRLRQTIDGAYTAEVLYNQAEGCVLRSLEMLTPPQG